MGANITYFDNEQKCIVCADTRIKYQLNDEPYSVAGNYSKLRQFGDKVIYVSGLLNVAESIFNSLDESVTLEWIAEKTKETVREFKEALPDVVFETKLYVYMMENEIPVIYQIGDKTEFIPLLFDRNGKNLITVGIDSNLVANYIENSHKENSEKSVDQAIYDTFVEYMSETIGGVMQSFILSNEGIKSLTAPIGDKTELRQIVPALYTI